MRWAALLYLALVPAVASAPVVAQTGGWHPVEDKATQLRVCIFAMEYYEAKRIKYTCRGVFRGTDGTKFMVLGFTPNSKSEAGAAVYLGKRPEGSLYYITESGQF